LPIPRSLERLSKEPELLRADQEHIRRQIEDTTVEKYRAFLTTAQCLADLRQQLQAATGSLDALVKDLPKLQAATEQFKQDAAAANAKRADNRLLYSEYNRTSGAVGRCLPALLSVPAGAWGLDFCRSGV